MKEIKLTQGKIALVDDADYEWLNKYTWCYTKGGYAASFSMIWEYKVRNLALMHRVILGASKGVKIDHINGNKLDNRRENIRLCTQAQNNRNRPKQTNNKSGYKGVIVMPRETKTKGLVEDIISIIKMDGKKIYLGSFRTREEAALAYNEAAIKYHGEFANLNKLDFNTTQ